MLTASLGTRLFEQGGVLAESAGGARGRLEQRTFHALKERGVDAGARTGQRHGAEQDPARPEDRR
ncbi:MAG: hypothetical protein J0I79_09395 [Mesorhizobium sp.]|uniref:hypothetical protein n=1 Tax=Mesorhizobium sp. TaxID=1871066 RepID=UPI001AD3876E|nr:hypothetical protein [Mesorhizobium sp.]MBN9218154.1 hypothetical protein [Mesorhizobium sp.]